MSTPSAILRCSRLALVPLVAGALAMGCDETDPEALPVWTPADHDNASKPAQTTSKTATPAPEAGPSGPSGMPQLEKHGITEVTLATWKERCARCHGIIGRGDGPEGPAYRPPDLTSPEWQRKTLDVEIERAIREGLGKMPSFSDLPPETVESLRKLVRLLNSERPASPSDAPTP